MITKILRAAAITLLCGLTLLVGATPALAHARLQSSNPADGSSTATAPQRVSLTFNEPMQQGFATLTVIGPDGTAYQSGEATADGDTVGIGVSPLGPAGRYEIGYRVVSEDGHPVTGSVAFMLTAPGPAATTAAAPSRRPRRPRRIRPAPPRRPARPPLPSRPRPPATTAAPRCGRGSSAEWYSSRPARSPRCAWAADDPR